MNKNIETIFTNDFNFLSLILLFDDYVNNEKYIPAGSNLLHYSKIFEHILKHNCMDNNKKELDINFMNELCLLKESKFLKFKGMLNSSSIKHNISNSIEYSTNLTLEDVFNVFNETIKPLYSNLNLNFLTFDITSPTFLSKLTKEEFNSLKSLEYPLIENLQTFNADLIEEELRIDTHKKIDLNYLYEMFKVRIVSEVSAVRIDSEVPTKIIDFINSFIYEDKLTYNLYVALLSITKEENIRSKDYLNYKSKLKLYSSINYDILEKTDYETYSSIVERINSIVQNFREFKNQYNLTEDISVIFKHLSNNTFKTEINKLCVALNKAFEKEYTVIPTCFNILN